MDIKYTKELHVKRNADVLVVGAGPSGLCAAVASARAGADTVLAERYGALGGNLTLGHVSPIAGRVCAGTLGNEISRMSQPRIPLSRFAHDCESLKQALPGWVKASGVKFYLQTVLVDVVKENDGVTGGVFTSPEGLFVIRCKQMVDATGDGLACLYAGAPMLAGREEDGAMQPASLMFTVAGVDDEKAITGGNHTYDVRMPDLQPEFRIQCAIASQNGVLPRNAAFVRLYRGVRAGECCVNATQANCINATRVDDIEHAELVLRDQIPHIVSFLRMNVKGFGQCYLADSADTLGVRETNRIDGEYRLTEQDIRSGRRFEDAVVHDANFILDVHGVKQGGQDVSEHVQDYDIPYGCLIPKQIENLIAVGRCISGTHLAHSSYRVMRIAMAIGEAGGVAAALCARDNEKPRGLKARRIQEVLRANGVALDDDAIVGMA